MQAIQEWFASKFSHETTIVDPIEEQGPFPKPLLIELSAYLTVQDLIHLKLTCRSWRQIFASNEIWKNLIDRLFPHLIPERPVENWFTLLKCLSPKANIVDPIEEQGPFPKPLLIELSAYLTVQDLIHLTLTCRSWRQIFASNEIWKNLIDRLFPHLIPERPVENWFSLLKYRSPKANIIPKSHLGECIRVREGKILSSFNLFPVQSIHEISLSTLDLSATSVPSKDFTSDFDLKGDLFARVANTNELKIWSRSQNRWVASLEPNFAISKVQLIPPYLTLTPINFFGTGPLKIFKMTVSDDGNITLASIDLHQRTSQIIKNGDDYWIIDNTGGFTTTTSLEDPGELIFQSTTPIEKCWMTSSYICMKRKNSTFEVFRSDFTHVRTIEVERIETIFSIDSHPDFIIIQKTNQLLLYLLETGQVLFQTPDNLALKLNAEPAFAHQTLFVPTTNGIQTFEFKPSKPSFPRCNFL